MRIETSNRLPLMILLAAHLLTIMDIFIVNIALPSIQVSLMATAENMQLIVAMYMIGFASFLIVGGKAGDFFGRRKVFMTGIFLFMLSSAGCGLATSPSLLITMRFVQGISAGLMSPQVLSYIQVLFKDHAQRTYALGWYGIFIGLGTVLGQFLGGLLIEMATVEVHESWRYIFLVNLPVCLIILVLSGGYLAESKDVRSVQIDFFGAGILCTGLVLLVFFFTTGFENSYQGSGILITSVFLLSGFMISQKRRESQMKEPLLSSTLFTYRNFNMAILGAGLFMFMLDAYFFVLTIFLQQGMELAPTTTGYFVVFQGYGFILSSLFSARLVLRYGKWILVSGVAIIILALMLQTVLFSERDTGLLSLTLMLVHGIGVALVLPSFANIGLKRLPEHLIGNASGVYSTLQQLFGALGIAFTGGMFLKMGNSGNYQMMLSAFKYATLVNVICLVGVLLILLYLPESILPQQKIPRECTEGDVPSPSV